MPLMLLLKMTNVTREFMSATIALMMMLAQRGSRAGAAGVAATWALAGLLVQVAPVTGALTRASAGQLAAALTAGRRRWHSGVYACRVYGLQAHK